MSVSVLFVPVEGPCFREMVSKSLPAEWLIQAPIVVSPACNSNDLPSSNTARVRRFRKHSVVLSRNAGWVEYREIGTRVPGRITP